MNPGRLNPMFCSFVICSILGCENISATQPSNTKAEVEPRTVFQSFAPFSPAIDIRTDAAIVYGVDASFAKRAAEWKAQGYKVEMMTGSAWGDYSDYTSGRFDGTPHEDEGQVDPQGHVIGHNAGVPYMVPAPSFSKYLVSLSNKAIDAGATALYYEEPEFWSRAGYSKGFQKLFETEYGEKWMRPDSSPDAFWRTARLKYLLYKRHLGTIIAGAREYAKQTGRDIKCYVPTHSLVNYSQWSIVSPESSLMDLPDCDGYIAQVWTGTARTPNTYRGKRKERTFETAFLEYSSMWNMVAPTGRTVYFLADPVEDDPSHTWNDYRANYERTVAASLLFPGVNHFEVMPWPDRVMTHAYPAGSYPGKDGKTTIPQDYARELMFVVNALENMKQGKVAWDCGASDIGVLVSDSMMFQRASKWGDNDSLVFGAFYGLALPLVEHGIPARCVVLEQVLQPQALAGVHTLVMSYAAMKPMKPEYNNAIAQWVKAGGHLVYVGDDSDPFNNVRAWWNQDGKTSGTARSDLFKKCEMAGLPSAETGSVAVGKGLLSWRNTHPDTLAQDPHGDEVLFNLLKSGPKAHPVATKPWFKLQRGPYVVGSVLEETGSTKLLELKGIYLDLFTSDAALVVNPAVQPGKVFLFRQVDFKNAAKGSSEPQLLAGTARLENTKQTSSSVEMTFRGPASLQTDMAVLSLQEKPGAVKMTNGDPVTVKWDQKNHLLRLSWQHQTGPAHITIESSH